MEKLFKDLRSWKTTICGVIGGLIICLGQIQNIVDKDPETVFVEATFIVGLSMMGIGIAAKDGDKSSEDVTK